MFTTKTGAAVRLRTTIVIESDSQSELEDALQQASELAKAQVIFMSFRASKKQSAASVCVRTTRAKGQR